MKNLNLRAFFSALIITTAIATNAFFPVMASIMQTDYSAEALLPLPELVKIKTHKLQRVQTVDLTDYRKLPEPGKAGDYASYKKLIDAVSYMAAVDPKIMATIAAKESSFRADVRASGGRSSAAGLYQFTGNTWEETVAKHGARFGITLQTSRLDAKANALMAAMRISDNIDLLGKVVSGREITETDIYLTHLLGRTGALQFLSADGKAIVAKEMPRAAKSNPEIFYHNGKKTAPRTYAQMYAALDSRFAAKAVEFDIQ